MDDTNKKSNKGKAGAPKGNSNRFRHGLHASKLPAKARHIENVTNIMRREIESVLITQNGEITIFNDALITSAIRHERRAKLLERWLRLSETKDATEEQKLKAMERVAILAQISAATDSRDKCLERLGLDKHTNDPWAGIDSD